MKTITFILLLIFCPILLAAPHQGTVVKMEFGPVYGGIVHVDMSFNNQTACATNANGYDYSFDSNTQIGEKMFATLLAAQKSKTIINVSGTGACTVNRWGKNTENIRWLQSK